MFDGPFGGITAKVMARLNLASEREAIANLAPKAGQTIFVIGFGAGVGLSLLDGQAPDLSIVAADPSAAMMRAAERRNRDAIAAGRLRLMRGVAESVMLPSSSIDGAIAVNAIQLCDLGALARKLAELMKPGVAFETITHGWALERRHGSVAAFERAARGAFVAAGFEHAGCVKAAAERGKAIRFFARR